MEFRDDVLIRYARQILLSEVGEDGQERLSKARVLIVGAGGLGVPVASYLGASGVSVIGIADGDTVALSNLPRQVAYATEDVGALKTAQLKAYIIGNNPLVEVVEHPYLTEQSVRSIVADYDIVADCSDNFPTRYLVNAACMELGKILVFAALSRFSGQLAVFSPLGSCYQCMVPEPPDRAVAQSCVEGGILGPVAGLVGCWQALEVLKQILGIKPNMQGKLMLLDGLDNRTHMIRLIKNTACPVCGKLGG
uniref:Molybdopterin biosynthesis protein moeB n=1 Tax=mine drainage metagenome TaxID=410659 RepID=E6QQ73_9ZZZZ